MYFVILDKVQEEGVSVWKVDVGPAHALVIPPGFLVSNCSVSKESSVGLKKLFLPRGDIHRRRFSAIADAMLTDDAPARQIASATLDAMALQL